MKTRILLLAASLLSINKDLSVSYGDPDTAFWQPSLGQK